MSRARDESLRGDDRGRRVVSMRVEYLRRLKAGGESFVDAIELVEADGTVDTAKPAVRAFEVDVVALFSEARDREESDLAGRHEVDSFELDEVTLNAKGNSADALDGHALAVRLLYVACTDWVEMAEEGFVVDDMEGAATIENDLKERGGGCVAERISRDGFEVAEH